MPDLIEKPRTQTADTPENSRGSTPTFEADKIILDFLRDSFYPNLSSGLKGLGIESSSGALEILRLKARDILLGIYPPGDFIDTIKEISLKSFEVPTRAHEALVTLLLGLAKDDPKISPLLETKNNPPVEISLPRSTQLAESKSVKDSKEIDRIIEKSNFYNYVLAEIHSRSDALTGIVSTFYNSKFEDASGKSALDILRIGLAKLQRDYQREASQLSDSGATLRIKRIFERVLLDPELKNLVSDVIDKNGAPLNIKPPRPDELTVRQATQELLYFVEQYAHGNVLYADLKLNLRHIANAATDGIHERLSNVLSKFQETLIRASNTMTEKEKSDARNIFVRIEVDDNFADIFKTAIDKTKFPYNETNAAFPSPDEIIKSLNENGIIDYIDHDYYSVDDTLTDNLVFALVGDLRDVNEANSFKDAVRQALVKFQREFEELDDIPIAGKLRFKRTIDRILSDNNLSKVVSDILRTDGELYTFKLPSVGDPEISDAAIELAGFAYELAELYYFDDETLRSLYDQFAEITPGNKLVSNQLLIDLLITFQATIINEYDRLENAAKTNIKNLLFRIELDERLEGIFKAAIDKSKLPYSNETEDSSALVKKDTQPRQETRQFYSALESYLIPFLNLYDTPDQYRDDPSSNVAITVLKERVRAILKGELKPAGEQFKIATENFLNSYIQNPASFLRVGSARISDVLHYIYNNPSLAPYGIAPQFFLPYLSLGSSRNQIVPKEIEPDRSTLNTLATTSLEPYLLRELGFLSGSDHQFVSSLLEAVTGFGNGSISIDTLHRTFINSGFPNAHNAPTYKTRRLSLIMGELKKHPLVRAIRSG